MNKISHLTPPLPTLDDCGESSLYWFEKMIDGEAGMVWLGDNWTLSIWLSIAYVVVIFSLKYYMEEKDGYWLRTPYIAWNAFLAVFSLFGTWRTYRPIVIGTFHYGMEDTTCNNKAMCSQMPVWYTLFYVSKVLELLDTVFIVLRKRPLIFLHWYHHATVLMYVWWTTAEPLQGPGRWFMFMNYFVHTLMYSYFALSGMRFKLPGKTAITITSMQIMQMVMGLVVNGINLRVKLRGDECEQSYLNMLVSSIMYFSYFFLFARFFRTRYLKRGISIKTH